jgi:phosphate:Na+ symporter
VSISNAISLFGGIALFLFGMSLMGDGLKKVAGDQLELVLFRLSNTPLKALLLGTGVTAAIQSSSATSVMVVGFVNSGMMDLQRAVSVIHGALIGTSITAWIICLSAIEGAGWVSIFSTTTISAVVAVIGIILRMFSKKQKKRHIGDILLGFAVLMFGMSTMSTAVSPLRESKLFINLFTSFSNPIIGILAGLVFSVVLQSASAAVGILQALSLTGAVTFAEAYPLILGIAVGASFPVLLSSMGARVEGRRTAWSYLTIEGIAVILCALIYYGLNALIGLPFEEKVMTPVSIAALNTVFRLGSALLLIPFNKLIVKLMNRLIHESEEEKSLNKAFSRLDERFLEHPSLALEQSRLTANDMALAARSNLSQALSLIDYYSEEGFREVERLEELVDRYEDKLGTYLIKINTNELDTRQNENAAKYLHSLSDLERMSDHASNIAELAREINEKKIVFSPAANHEIEVLTSALGELMNMTVESFVSDNVGLAYRVEPLEECIDILCDTMKINHVDRLKKGECSINVGFVFNDLITNIERVADHCSNIAVAMIEIKEDAYDTHGYIIDLKEKRSHNFDRYYAEYTEKYKL